MVKLSRDQRGESSVKVVDTVSYQGSYLQELFLKNEDSRVIAFRIKSIPGLHNNAKLLLNKLRKDDTLNYKHIVISREGIVKHGKTEAHLHGLVLDTRKSLPVKQYTQDLRMKIKEIIPSATGNKHLYVKEADCRKQLLKYTLKEGNVEYCGFTHEFIKSYHKKSKRKEDLKQKIMNNEDSLLDGKQTYLEFQSNHVQIKVDHGQPLYRSHIGAYFQTYKIRSGTMSAKEWVTEQDFDRDYRQDPF